jgi:outer membrane protein assembly factor BamA
MYDAALSKSYFLPRAIFTDHQMKYFYKDLRAFLEQAGILVQFEEIRNKNYGIMIHFKIAQSDKVYLLEKLIDANNKTLDFVITEKM